MRIFCDENVQSFVVDLLRLLGHDVETAKGVGLAGAPDPKIREYAIANDRHLLTHNSDFADARAFARHPAGIIRLRVEPQTAQMLLPVVRQAFAVLAKADLCGKLVTITPGRPPRVRRL